MCIFSQPGGWADRRGRRRSEARARTDGLTSPKVPDLIEGFNLDEKGQLTGVRDKIRDAGERLRKNDLPRLPKWQEHTTDPGPAAATRV